MSDLAKYVKTRAARDPEFADGLESGYTDFKVGALLRQARENAGLTQEQVADRLETKKSAISRIENSAGSIRAACERGETEEIERRDWFGESVGVGRVRITGRRSDRRGVEKRQGGR